MSKKKNGSAKTKKPVKRANPTKKAAARKPAVKKKHKGGAPALGLGPRFSCALFADQHKALMERMAKTRETQAVALRNVLPRNFK